MSDESKEPQDVPESSEPTEPKSVEANADSPAEPVNASETPAPGQPGPEFTEKPEIPAIGKKQSVAEIKETIAEASEEKPVELVTDRPQETAKPETAAPQETAAKPEPEAPKPETPKPEATAPQAETPKPEAAAKPAPPKAAVPPKAPPVAGAAAKPAPPAKKGPTITEEIKDDPFIDKLKAKFGDAITEAVKTLGQRIVRVNKGSYLEMCRFLVEDEDGAFAMCADLTALHWPDKTGEEFDIVVNLYSVANNQRLRVKTAIADGEAAPSVTSIWEGANWMEREVFDMFGVKFDGHPDLRRILLPEDWPGFPLRKEYPIEYRDNEWTDKHIDYLEVEYDTSLIDVKYAERR